LSGTLDASTVQQWTDVAGNATVAVDASTLYGYPTDIFSASN